jgi:hypothetical protein
VWHGSQTTSPPIVHIVHSHSTIAAITISGQSQLEKGQDLNTDQNVALQRSKKNAINVLWKITLRIAGQLSIH